MIKCMRLQTSLRIKQISNMQIKYRKQMHIAKGMYKHAKILDEK